MKRPAKQQFREERVHSRSQFHVPFDGYRETKTTEAWNSHITSSQEQRETNACMLLVLSAYAHTLSAQKPEIQGMVPPTVGGVFPRTWTSSRQPRPDTPPGQPDLDNIPQWDSFWVTEGYVWMTVKISNHTCPWTNHSQRTVRPRSTSICRLVMVSKHMWLWEEVKV